MLDETQLRQLKNNYLMNWLEKERGFRFGEHERAEMERWQKLFLDTYQHAENGDIYRLERNQLRKRVSELSQEKDKLFNDYQKQARISLEILKNRNYEPVYHENQQLKTLTSELEQQKVELEERIARHRSLERQNAWQIAGLKIVIDFHKKQKEQDQTIFLNNLRDKQNKLNSLKAGSNISDELLDKLENTRLQKLKQVILLTKQLTAEQENNKDLIKLINRLEKKLEKSKKRKKELVNAKKYHRQQINNLNTKLTKATQEKKDLKTQLATEKKNHQNTNRLVQQQQTIVKLNSRLNEKDKIIQQQAQRIKELENKPPVIQTKKQEIIQKNLVTSHQIL